MFVADDSGEERGRENAPRAITGSIGEMMRGQIEREKQRQQYAMTGYLGDGINTERELSSFGAFRYPIEILTAVPQAMSGIWMGRPREGEW